MPSLYVLRHATAAAPTQEDHERPLTPHGKEEAGAIGAFLKKQDELPDYVLSSSARRARETAEAAQAQAGWSVETQTEKLLYEVGPSGVIELLRDIPPSRKGVLLVGHQPTLSLLISELSASPTPAFPPASLARVDFSLPWPDLESGTGTLKWVMTQRLLGQLE